MSARRGGPIAVPAHDRDNARREQEPAAHEAPKHDVAPEAAWPAPVGGLMVGAVGDRAEIDADRRAAEVLARLSGPGAAHKIDHADRGTHSAQVRRSTSSSGAMGAAGGPADASTSAAISAKLGRGPGLDGTLRRRAEGAFGRSFANVRVHDDAESHALNERLSATAFTYGSDIFFSRGAYRPADEDGERLVAHELAHVEQESDPVRRSIRRAVGFEFETNVMVKKRVTTLKGKKQRVAFEPYGKAAVLKQGNGFRMEADEHSIKGSSIEFVIDPPVAEDDRAKLVKILTDLQEITTEIEKAGRTQKAVVAKGEADVAFAKKQGAYNKQHTKLAKKGNTEEAIIGQIGELKNVQDDADPIMDFAEAGVTGVVPEAWLQPEKHVNGIPQATGGIAFDKLLSLMTEMGNSSDKAAKDLTVASSKGASALDKGDRSKWANAAKLATPPNGMPATPSDELLGMIAILAMYLDQGRYVDDDSTPPLNYAKLLSGSMLMRTDFGSMRNALKPAEKDALRDHPLEFADWVLAVAGLSGTGKIKVYERGVLKDYHKGKAGGTIDIPGFQLSRDQWLGDIAARGFDRFSAAAQKASGEFRGAEVAEKLEGLGRLGNKWDTVGNGNLQGVIMEFRQMKSGIAMGPQQFATTALNVFDYIVALNAGTQQK